jgi:hypothetical protein
MIGVEQVLVTGGITHTVSVMKYFTLMLMVKYG